MVSKLLAKYPKYLAKVTPSMLDRWLDAVEGWAEVDSLCQALFSAKQFLASWGQWKSGILHWSKDKNIHKRRASLVLLTTPVRQSNDGRLSDLAFANIEVLKKEKDILITKAISWLLRDLIKYHRASVSNHIKMHKDTLPKIAIREVQRKLLTGKK